MPNSKVRLITRVHSRHSLTNDAKIVQYVDVGEVNGRESGNIETLLSIIVIDLKSHFLVWLCVLTLCGEKKPFLMQRKNSAGYRVKLVKNEWDLQGPKSNLSREALSEDCGGRHMFILCRKALM